MKRNTLFILILLVSSSAFAGGKPYKDGTYTYKLRMDEHNTCPGTVKVVIKGSKIDLIHDGSMDLSQTKKDDVIESGIIVKHKSGVWIIGKEKKDKDLKEVGGCTETSTIDFKKKEYHRC